MVANHCCIEIIPCCGYIIFVYTYLKLLGLEVDRCSLMIVFGGNGRQWAWDEIAKQMLYHSVTLFHDNLFPFFWLRI
jgi:hypothetical protein